MSTDIKAKYMAASGAAGVGGTRTRIRSLYCLCTATAGSVVITDPAQGGAQIFKVDTPAVAADIMVYIPDDGILCQGDPTLTLTNVTSVTFFYG